VISLIQAIFGPDLNATIVLRTDNKDASKCQISVAKSVTKCWRATLKQLNVCKKSGLEDGSITNAALLASSCLGADPAGKIAKSCDPETGRIKDSIGKKCQAPVGPLSDVFAGCNTDDAEELAACLDLSVKCKACLGLAAVDRFDSVACDSLDDGVVNGSCEVCGNGFLQGDEECDDGNVLDGDGCSATCQIDICGDGNCAATENSANCIEDCGFCGDGFCSSEDPNHPEDPGNCLLDCATDCGDGVTRMR
jgi:cysteine-rich repeat protein